MKLIIQIPCYNEEHTLPNVLREIPQEIEGIHHIETLVIDDGSTDRTAQVAQLTGANHVIRNIRNLGLAFSFRRGLDAALALGADIVVNMDGDNQYPASRLADLIAPILRKEADIVVANRQTDRIEHFSPLKRRLQRWGSAIMRRLSGTEVRDAVSGFRAFSRDAAIKITILSNYTYTLESILQAKAKGLTISNIDIETNPKIRESRLIKSLRAYLTFSAATIVRVFAMYNPLRIFFPLGGLLLLAGILLGLRFLYYYTWFGGSGKIQSLLLATLLCILGSAVVLVGLIADLIQFNRRLLEDVLERVKKLELKDSYTPSSD
ncbi:MAG: glycosyltransferase family 2 protein [Bdellovibrionales bacterium]|nr:glycosyltransferase family 2 protein [Bdellovibrionales bacterium]